MFTLAYDAKNRLISVTGAATANFVYDGDGKQVKSTVNAQTAAAGAQQNATQSFQEADKSAKDAFQALAKVARALFLNDPDRLATLGLTGPMPKDIAGFLAAAYTLFDNAMSVAEFGNVGYISVKLQSERGKITALDAANQNQEMLKGAAQQATQEQNAALDALNEWVAQYRKIAKVVLRGKKQLLEKIGILARTSKTAAQRAAPAKAAATRAKKKQGGQG